MKRSFLLSAVFIGVCFTTISANAQTATVASANNPAQAPSAKDFARNPANSFSISPDGKALAYLLPQGAKNSVIILNLETNAAKTVPLGDEAKPRRVYWANNGFAVVVASITASYDGVDSTRRIMREFVHRISIARDGSSVKVLMSNPELRGNLSFPMVHSHLEDDNFAIMSARIGESHFGTSGRLNNFDTRDWFHTALYKVDLRTGIGRQVEHGNNETIDWAVNSKGQAVVRVDYSDSRKTVSYYVRSGNGGWRRIFSYEVKPGDSPYDLEGIIDDKTALLIDSRGDTKKALYLNLATGVLTNAFEDETRSISSVGFDAITYAPNALFFEGYTPQMRWLDADMARYQGILEKSFPGKDVSIVSKSEDRSKMVIVVDSNNAPLQTYLFNTKDMTAEKLSDNTTAMESFRFGARTLEEFTARDGMKIPVFVTKPSNGRTAKAPMIVLPHGGPQAQDRSGFEDWAHFFSSRGYLVLQPQFRGSTGKGKKFEEAGFGEWGGKMQHDVSDSVKWAIEQGWADAQRVCIVGASYGGYAAFAGATMTPELYACSVSYSGVSDLAVMQGYASRETGSVKYWEKHMGLTRFNSQQIDAKSPAKLARNVRGPMLILHGKDDTVVPLEQSQIMADAMKAAGKPYEFIEFEGADHWLLREDGRLKFFSEVERFVKPILKPEQ